VSRFWVFWMTKTIRNVTIVVPVLMTSCHVSDQPKNGPVTAHRATARIASTKSGRAAELLLNPAREAGEARPFWRSIVLVMLAHRQSGGQIIGLQSRLNASHQQKHDDDHEQEAEATTRVISPAGAMRPGRQRPYQYKDQDDEKDRAKHCDTGASFRYSTNVRR